MKTNINKNIKTRFNKFIMINFIIELLIIIVGLVLIFYPDLTTKVVGTIISLLLFSYAGSLAYNYFKRDGAKLYSFNIGAAIVIAVLGLILLFYPYSIMSFVTKIIALFLVFSGATRLNYVFWLKKANEKSWIMLLILSVTTMGLGFILLLDPFAYLDVTRILGTFMIISSLLRICDNHLFKSKQDEILKIFW